VASQFVSVLPRAAIADLVPPFGVRERRWRFGEERHQYVLTFVPTTIGTSTPFVHFLHGGSWSGGSARRYRFVGRYLAARGIPAAVCGYRLAPGDRWPAQLHDAAAGVAAAFEADAELRARPVILAGHSAGGQIAAMLALDQTHLANAGATPAGLLTLAAPLDFGAYRRSPLIERLTGHSAPWPEADPVAHVHGGMPPTLVVTGGSDTVVAPEIGRRFVEAAEKVAPGQATLLEIPKLRHVEILRLFLAKTAEGPGLIEWIEQRE
jgi:acetyl esterase/lipase